MPRKNRIKKQERKCCNLWLIFFIVLVLGFAIGFAINTKTEIKEKFEEKFQEIVKVPSAELDLSDFVEANISIGGPAGNTLQFIWKCKEIDMNIIDIQALAIKNGLEKKFEIRPLTHDLMASIFENFNITVLFVKIDRADEAGLYYAKTLLQRNNQILALDSRPSDAAAIAARAGSKIYFKRELLEKLGKNIC